MAGDNWAWYIAKTKVHLQHTGKSKSKRAQSAEAISHTIKVEAPVRKAVSDSKLLTPKEEERAPKKRKTEHNDFQRQTTLPLLTSTEGDKYLSGLLLDSFNAK